MSLLVLGWQVAVKGEVLAAQPGAHQGEKDGRRPDTGHDPNLAGVCQVDELCARVGLRVLKIGMSWPLEPVSVHNFAEGLDEILVVEEKRSIIEDQLTGQLYNWPVGKRPRVVGEFDEQGNSLLPNLAELTPAMIARVIAKRLAPIYTSPQIEERLAFLAAKEDLESLLFSFYRTVVTSRKAHLRGESLVPDFADACYATATV